MHDASRAIGSGLVAAMSMSGLRNVTVNLGLLDELPPREILSDQAPRLVRLLSEGHEEAFAELAHWSYGSVCGLVYDLGFARRRPDRSRRWGPGFGLATLALYRGIIAPALGIETTRPSAVTDQLMLVVDHMLFGVVLDELLRAGDAGGGSDARRRRTPGSHLRTSRTRLRVASFIETPKNHTSSVVETGLYAAGSVPGFGPRRS